MTAIAVAHLLKYLKQSGYVLMKKRPEVGPSAHRGHVPLTE
jgi:hypothetical protein